jgi:hypothetical protein
MQGGLINYRFIVGLPETEVKGGQYGTAKTISAGNKDTPFEPQMINLKTGDFLHDVYSCCHAGMAAFYRPFRIILRTISAECFEATGRN